jgi:hypothetical protein
MEQSILLHEALVKHGADSTLTINEGGKHGMGGARVRNTLCSEWMR